MMMKKTIIILIIMIANFCSKIDGQVNLQTGSATYNIPIFNWKDTKSRLNNDIGLSYNSGSGLKVDELASNIGQGWGLIGLGVITRIQVGQPDDQMQNDGNGTINDLYKYPAGYLYNSISASQGCPNALGYYPIFGDQNHFYKQHNSIDADREQDYFSFQFNGKSGMFILGKNNGDHGILIGDSKLKITFQRNATLTTSQNIRTTIVSFSIQDDNGLIYTFNQWGTSKLLKMHPTSPGPNNVSQVQQNYLDGGIYYNSGFDEIPLSYNPYVINSWYLTQIQDPLTQRTINLNYVIRNCTSARDDISNTWCGGNTPTGFVPSKNYILINHNISVIQIPEISSIQYPDGYSVSFNYDSSQRYDYSGDYAMKSIDINYSNRLSSRFLLNTTYFILNNYGIPATVDQRIASRLCLKSITKVGLDAKENQSPIVFDYYTGSNSTEDFVPPPFYYAKDIYGYYNGNNMNNIRSNSPPIPILTTQLYDLSTQVNNFSYTQLSTLCFLSNNTSNGSGYSVNTINPGFAKNGLLASVTNQQGAKTTYEYQQNIYNALTSSNTVNRAAINSGNYIGGVHVSKISQIDGGYSNGNNNPISTTYNYVNADETTTSQWGFIDPSSTNITNYSFALDGAHKHFLGNCTYDYVYPGVLSREVLNSTIVSNQLIGILFFAGSEIVSNLLDLIIQGKEYAFDPGAIIYDLVVALIPYIFNSCDNSYQDGSTVTSSNSNQNASLIPIQYSRVEVQQINNGSNNGKTIYEFTDFTDYSLWWTAPPYNIAVFTANPYSMKQPAAFWAYGLPKKITIYDASGNLIKQTQNVYDWSNVQRNASSDQSCNCYVKYSSSLRSDNWSTYSNTSKISYSTNNYSIAGQMSPNLEVDAQLYNISTGRVVLSDTYERTFKPLDQTQYSETLTHYDYNSNNYQVNKITTTQSNGDKNIKEIYYVPDYTVNGILQTLNNNNLVNLPVATYNSVIKNGAGSSSYLGANIIDFAMTGNGDIKPARVMTGRSQQPLSNGFNFDPSNQFNYPNLIQTQTFTYDQNSNLVGTSDEGQRKVSNIYGYNSRFIIASVINADAIADMPAYTSFETQDFGGWTLNGSSNFINSISVTGSSSFMLSASNSLTAALNTSKPYILSLWATSNNISLNVSSTLLKSAPSINGFTYYEYLINQGSSSVTISSNGATIDELRLYPQNARMKTVAYDELFGKTAECDENNRIVYYEYDNLTRLRFVKDENHYIVKMYEYGDMQRSSGTGISPVIIVNSARFAKLSLENIYYDPYGDVNADVVVRFYTDAACTQPYYVNNLVVSFNSVITCDSECSSWSWQTSQTVSGYSAVLAASAILVYPNTWQDQAGNQYPCRCLGNYNLTSASGYTIVN